MNICINVAGEKMGGKIDLEGTTKGMKLEETLPFGNNFHIIRL